MWSDHQKGRRLHNCKGITDKKFTTLGQHDTFAKFRRQRLLENTDFCNPDLSMKERKIIFQIIVCSFPQCILMYYCCMVHSEYCMVWILMPVMCKMRTQVIFFCQTSFVLWIANNSRKCVLKNNVSEIINSDTNFSVWHWTAREVVGSSKVHFLSKWKSFDQWLAISGKRDLFKDVKDSV